MLIISYKKGNKKCRNNISNQIRWSVKFFFLFLFFNQNNFFNFFLFLYLKTLSKKIELKKFVDVDQILSFVSLAVDWIV